MATAILHGGPGDNTVLTVSGEPSEIQFEVVTKSVVMQLPHIQTKAHPAPRQDTQLETVTRYLYFKCHKIIPDGNLHYLDQVNYQNLLKSRPGF